MLPYIYVYFNSTPTIHSDVFVAAAAELSVYTLLSSQIIVFISIDGDVGQLYFLFVLFFFLALFLCCSFFILFVFVVVVVAMILTIVFCLRCCY